MLTNAGFNGRQFGGDGSDEVVGSRGKEGVWTEGWEKGDRGEVRVELQSLGCYRTLHQCYRSTVLNKGCSSILGMRCEVFNDFSISFTVVLDK